ncbi:MAG: bifunctional DNA-formamidopyrimidine glycosylase/DNA-(apurinic or apyrimidinic site) lyase [Gammaproteobacteria bacterium]
MPELPEVETTRRGIATRLVGKKVVRVIVREPRLRWPIPQELALQLPGNIFSAVERRAKYLMLKTPAGCLIAHLGMSGSLRIFPATAPLTKHDHADIVLDNNTCLRLHDPRRFGALLWTNKNPLQHPLLINLGPEPLEADFNGAYLYRQSRGRSVAVKNLIMDSRIVAGVGNIYASEALFTAGIHPARAAGRISRQRYELLSQAIKQVLNAALEQGGTTLRDYYASDGKAGYFKQQLKVYGRAEQPCITCKLPVRLIRQGQRSSYYCKYCQR